MAFRTSKSYRYLESCTRATQRAISVIRMQQYRRASKEFMDSHMQYDTHIELGKNGSQAIVAVAYVDGDLKYSDKIYI